MPPEVTHAISNHGQIALDNTVSIYSATIVVAESITQRLGYTLREFKKRPRSAPFVPLEDVNDAMLAVGIQTETVPQLMQDVQQIMTFDLI
jgi:hypothetical protein